ncbi:hypothetical protein [Oceanibaculum indicum]|uniref:Peptidoglycan-binding domain-containing protein n=1 Tax=Oceanibaculum indicum P24 TaxID=1207063 RepID=K2JVD3_9PROT|nr:hypothetical protein [Oceanibaculum indicum]EKE78527.1 peptidoglycan-binding domain-containing protein [Oceanibaculum indicum P24]
MAQISPWSVKGVSPEDREAAKRAARQAGLPVGAWLSQAIRHAGQEPTNRPVGGPASGTPTPDPDQAAEIIALHGDVAILTARLDALSDTVARLKGDLAALADESSAQAAARNSAPGTEPGEIPLDVQAAQAALERAVLRLSDRLRVLEEETEQVRSRKSAGLLRRLFGGR